MAKHFFAYPKRAAGFINFCVKVLLICICVYLLTKITLRAIWYELITKLVYYELNSKSLIMCFFFP